MRAKTYDALNAEAMRLYGEQRYAEALDLLTREGASFSDNAADVAYLRSCLAARTGQPELAVAILEEALGQGIWYGEQVMRMTPSWQSLQGRPDFERVAVVCQEREAAEHTESRVFVWEPEGGIQAGKAHPLFIALHGNGDNGTHALQGWQPVTSNGWLLAAVQSSQMGRSDAYGWFDVDLATREITAQYQTLSDAYAIDTRRVLLAGFSMGGELALRIALQGSIPARGFVLLGPGGALETPEDWRPYVEAGKARGLRGYVIVGADDVNVSQEGIRGLVALLNDSGIPCGLEAVAELGHAYPPEREPVIRRALHFVEGM